MRAIEYVVNMNEIDILTTLQINTYDCLKIDRFDALVSNKDSKLTFGTYRWFKKIV